MPESMSRVMALALRAMTGMCRDRIFAQDPHYVDAWFRQIDVHQDDQRLRIASNRKAEGSVHRRQQLQVGAPRDELFDHLHVRRR